MVATQTVEKPGRSESTETQLSVEDRRQLDARLSALQGHFSVFIRLGEAEECQRLLDGNVRCFPVSVSESRREKPASSRSLRQCELSLAHFSLLTGTVQRCESSPSC